MARQTADYGLDAPGMVRGFLFGGGAAAVAGFFLVHWAKRRGLEGPLSIGFALRNVGIGCLVGATMCLASSYVGKFHVRDRLLRQLHLRGDETVLDVGCGRGLLLIGAAKLLPRGHAVGIDLWSQVDLSNNSREATLSNAKIEGVADRVDVRNGDMRKLPFADSIFDAAVAHFAIHNIRSHEGRREAIRQIVRVLKPGGQVALSDLKSVGLYADELRKSGMSNVRVSWPSFGTWPPSRIVTARKTAASE
ncbi:MAG TPA: class I SAM-dependent methyltransferase [Candidatus Acidoferrales bacterium]|nr:class I SAM-dependent methyltransferase [Candidatus Acidoferrales bacterium]